MKNFDRDSRGSADRGPKQFGTRDAGRRDFGGGGQRSFGGRPGGKPFLHPATCSKCGQQCQIPFKPTGDRPVYCSNCFETVGKPNSIRIEGSSFNRPANSFAEKRMFEATCSQCGDRCEVPFRPINGKPVYCSKCFDKGTNPVIKNIEQFKDQFDLLNKKLDRLIQALTPPAAPVSLARKELKENKEVKKDKEVVVKNKTALKKNKKK